MNMIRMVGVNWFNGDWFNGDWWNGDWLIWWTNHHSTNHH